jgi:predicted MPP superfamily phosphohydrolase
VGGAAVHRGLEGQKTLELTDIPLAVRGLPPALDGLRIGLLTDVHRSRWVSHEDVAAAVSGLMHLAPDLIVLGGDYVTWRDPAFIAPVAEALAPLSAPLGVFAVLGNHDDEREMPAALKAQGVEVLADARTQLTIRREPVDLLGVRYWSRQPDTVERLTRDASGGVSILLAHDPRRLPEAAAAHVSLVLSGHTHGGQIVLPVVGALAARRFPHVAGTAYQNRTTLFVSRGLGTVYVPVRINCPPEIALLTLRPIEDRAA